MNSMVSGMNHILVRMSHVYRVLRRVHHVRVIPLFLAALFACLRTVVWFGMLLDRLFFPQLARTRANRPIVLVGNPRTGTTFLQRFLADAGFGSGMELFLMLYPSLTLQRLLRPVLPLLERVSPARFHSTEAHETSLSSVETDDVGVLFRYLDGFFLYGFFLSFEEQETLPAFDPRERDTSERDFDWLDTLWRRSLVLHGAERNVAKLFSLAVRLPRFLERFPEAQILYMARDPLAVIPSSMSLMVGVLDRAFGFWSLPPEVRQRWLDRMYSAWILLLGKFHEDWTSGAIDKRRVYVVRYDRMMMDFEGVMDEMCAFLEHEMTPELRARVHELGEKQRKYESEHRYNLAKFGLTEEQIRTDCAFFYETFLPPLPTESWSAPAGSAPPIAAPSSAS
ncbi:MAG TPA: sulfotransferase [Polyangiaceae bacterium]|nr:sulfotransferase [Polyangiaceae bacterium]